MRDIGAFHNWDIKIKLRRPCPFSPTVELVDNDRNQAIARCGDRCYVWVDHGSNKNPNKIGDFVADVWIPTSVDEALLSYRHIGFCPSEICTRLPEMCHMKIAVSILNGPGSEQYKLINSKSALPISTDCVLNYLS